MLCLWQSLRIANGPWYPYPMGWGQLLKLWLKIWSGSWGSRKSYSCLIWIVKGKLQQEKLLNSYHREDAKLLLLPGKMRILVSSRLGVHPLLMLSGELEYLDQMESLLEKIHGI